MLLKAYFSEKQKIAKMANKKTDMSKVRKTILLYRKHPIKYILH